MVGEGGERRGALLRRRGETVGRLADAALQRRRDDRAIAGASAEIARKLVAKRRVRQRLAGMVGGEQAHHDARRAEAALRGVSVDHRLLQRMQLAARGEILDRDQFRAVKLAQEQNAGVKRLVGETAAPEPRQHDRACAAIPFGAAFLRSLRSHLLSQPVEDGGAGENWRRATSSPRKRSAARRARRLVWPQTTSSLLTPPP